MTKSTAGGMSPLRIAVLVLVGVAFVCLILLGNWQMRRLDWKQNLLSSVETRLHQAPVSLSEIEAMKTDGQDIEYRPVTVSGRFLHDQERHFFATFNGQSGYYVYTPLKLDDGRFIFINRGFVPFDMKTPETRMEGQVEGHVTVDGLARDRLSGKPSFVVPDNDLIQNIYYWKDLDAMITASGLDDANVLPFFIDANDAPNAGGLPAGGVTRLSFPNSHLQYALTWYGLAAVLAIGVGALIVRRWRDGRSA